MRSGGAIGGGAAGARAAALAATHARVDVESIGEVIVPLPDVLRIVDVDGAHGGAAATRRRAAVAAAAASFCYVPGRVHFRGVQRNVPLAFVSDNAAQWQRFFAQSYSSSIDVDELRDIPEEATHVLVGAVKAADLTPEVLADKTRVFALAAIGERRVVIPPADEDVGTEDTAVAHNGAYWYCVDGMSFGFAPTSEVQLQDADTTEVGGGRENAGGDRRLSWHMGNGCGGYRAGRETDIDGAGSGREWLKVRRLRCHRAIRRLNR